MEEPRLSSTIMASWRNPDATMCCSLRTNCKTHKPNGQICFRNLHINPAWMCDGLGRWVAGQLRCHMQGLPYLLRDASDLKRLLANVVAEPGDRLVKVDIKDFFMTGTRSD